MRALHLTLRGALRSWGAMSLGDDRWTEMRPTASAIVGLVGACVGIDRHDDALMSSWYAAWDVASASAIRWNDGNGCHHLDLREDFQSARGTLRVDGKDNPFPVISHRGYLQNARESVALVLREDADGTWFDAAAIALAHPVYTPYLGRRSNPLSQPMLTPDGIDRATSRAGIIEGLIRHLRQPGLMEDEVSIHSLELQAPQGWLADWSSGRQGDPATEFESLTITRHSLADVRHGARRVHARRFVDVAHIDFE